MKQEEENMTILSPRSVSQRYAKAVTNGEQLCCPTGYNHEDLGQFIPETVLKVSYGCGTPVGLSTVQSWRSRLGHWFGRRDRLL